MRKCERCGKPEVHSNDLTQCRHVGYCEVCSRNLCDACIAKGCCGNVPALDGEREEAADDH